MKIMKSRLKKFVVMLVAVALLVGNGSAIAMPAMAMSSSDRMAMMGDMAGMDMSASKNSMDCCGHADKDKGMKASACDACCAAMAQTAMLPAQYAAPVQYAVSHSYDLTDTMAVSKPLPPEPPPPKA
ncbi:MAG: hypothetical protein KGI37_03000 [Alphaproteobacteria bacterium]|nr:hypothetical protein [Alphaproteobacteria bacterium]